MKRKYIANIIANFAEVRESFLTNNKFLPQTNSETITEVAKEKVNSLFLATTTMNETVVLVGHGD